MTFIPLLFLLYIGVGFHFDAADYRTYSLGSHRNSYYNQRVLDHLEMAPTFYVGSEAGLKQLDEYLLSRSYITGYQASKDDLTVHAAFTKSPSPQYVNVSRWFNHIEALLRISGVSAEGSGVTVEGSASFPEEAIATPPVAETKAAADEDDDSDVDLFGEETEEEKKAAEARAAAVKASGKKKESGKSSVLLDVKPWDDETDMKKLEEAVRSVHLDGLLWGASKLVPVGYGIKKLQIMMTIVDDLVSVDTVIEERLTEEPINEYVQSCDIVAFNKICKFHQSFHLFQTPTIYMLLSFLFTDDCCCKCRVHEWIAAMMLNGFVDHNLASSILLPNGKLFIGVIV